jgi:uncharacterized delta-60 repeat protein
VLFLIACPGRAQIAGVDISFNPIGGVNGNVWSVAVQPDGKILIGGAFTAVNGIARNRIARLNPDGSLDAAFNPGSGANSDVQSVKLDSLGRVVIGGGFTSVNGTNRNRIARLNANGFLDTAFNPGTGASSTVWVVAVQSDNRVLIGGDFNSVNGNSRNAIARLTSTGALDDTFAPGTAATNGAVYAIAVDSASRILIGGSFSLYAGTGRTNIARINSNGTLDATFNPGAGTDSDIIALAIQSTGRILAGGDFTTVDGVSRKFLARFETNGVVDGSFNPNPNLGVFSIAVSGDDKILIGGDFNSINTVTRNYTARLLPGGALDATFDTSTTLDNTVESVALQGDGRVILGGWFTTAGGQSRNRIARLQVAPNALSPLLTGTRVGGSYTVSFSTLTNIAYLLEYKDSLSTTVWIPLAMVFGNGGTRQLTDPAANVPQRFYRLRTLYSQPHLVNARRIGNAFQVDVPAFAWRTMVLEYKNAIGDANWISLPGVAGDNTIKTLTDPAATVTTRVYRVGAY